mgnify:CR=1 FL=1
MRGWCLANAVGLRWCERCDHHHGPLFRCEHYPRWVIDEIEAGQVANRVAIVAKWKAGDRSVELHVMAAFASVDLDSLSER